MNDKLVSIIIRTKNEEKWIEACFKAVINQNYKNFEIILVDNESKDNTLELIKKYPHKLIKIREFKPGYAINEGIRASKGDIIVILSGHCIPTNEYWLENLIADLSDSRVAGVYGRQEPLSTSSSADKRDLLITFGLDPKIQHKDSFFHNANSALRRDIWLKYPFDENVKHIEDRVWGQEVISSGFKIHYQPLASVYHHHGIHHDGNQDRADRIVKILEELNSDSILETARLFSDVRVSAIIPLKSGGIVIGDNKLITKTLNDLEKSRFIDKIYICSDNFTSIPSEYNSKPLSIIPRPIIDDGNIVEVIRYVVNQIKLVENELPHLYLIAQETYPFRPDNFFDMLILSHLNSDDDLTISAKIESRNIWIENKKQELVAVSESYESRNNRPIKSYISCFGLGAVFNSGALNKSEIQNLNFGVHKNNHLLSMVEILNPSDYQYFLDRGLL